MKNKKLTHKETQEIIENVCFQLSRVYIFPDLAEKITQLLMHNLTSGFYKSITGFELVQKINYTLHSITPDNHLKVVFRSENIPQDNLKLKTQRCKYERLNAKDSLYGFPVVKILDHNIGYLKIEKFYPLKWSKNRIDHVLKRIKNTNGLIIDLRSPYGGDQETVTYIESYFLPENIHLEDIYSRQQKYDGSMINKIDEYWTIKVNGDKYFNPVYILVSHQTFSAAESFTYTLQQLNRAIVIGEVTGGGAHPTEFKRLTNHYGIFIPFARNVNFVTNSNWDKNGIKPNIEVPATNALNEAIKIFYKTEKNALPAY